MRVIFLSVLLFISCMNNMIKNKNEELSSSPFSAKKTNDLHFLKYSLSVIKSDFREFWNNFGHALQVNDTIALNNYMETSVFLYGREDQDPILELKNRERIIRVREIYANGGFYDYKNNINISYIDFFLDKNALNSDYVENQDYQEIKDFVFKRSINNEWKLTAVYTNTKILSY